MQIEPTHGFDPLSIREGSRNPVKADQVAPAGEKPAEQSEAASASLEPYIRRAAEAPEIRQDAVAQARRLLASGKLDTPESARRTAEGLLEHGI